MTGEKINGKTIAELREFYSPAGDPMEWALLGVIEQRAEEAEASCAAMRAALETAEEGHENCSYGDEYDRGYKNALAEWRGALSARKPKE